MWHTLVLVQSTQIKWHTLAATAQSFSKKGSSLICKVSSGTWTCPKLTKQRISNWAKLLGHPTVCRASCKEQLERKPTPNYFPDWFVPICFWPISPTLFSNLLYLLSTSSKSQQCLLFVDHKFIIKVHWSINFCRLLNRVNAWAVHWDDDCAESSCVLSRRPSDKTQLE